MSNADDQLDPIIDAYLTFLDGDGAAPMLDGLDPGLRAEATARIELLDALWRAGHDGLPAPDPVARRFGFDRAGQDITVDGTKVAILRQRRNIVLKDLAAMVNNGGGDTTTAALFRLEQSHAAPVPQPTASALAAALRASVADFVTTPDEDGVHVDAVRAFLDSAEFDELITIWAAEYHRDPGPVRREVAEQLAGAQFRAADVTGDQLLAIVRAILRRLES